MKEAYDSACRKKFCQVYLQTLDPIRAAQEIQCSDGYSLLGTKPMQKTLEQMRETAADQIRREDVLRRLAQLAFGGAGDAVKLTDPAVRADPEGLDLSAVSEFKVTEKGVEVKLVDRVRALETLFHLLEQPEQGALSPLCQALAETVTTEERVWENG